jgi:hypothetical protein
VIGAEGWGARHRGTVESCIERGDPLPPAFDKLRKPPLDLLIPVGVR